MKKDNQIFNIPSTWVWTTLDQIGIISSGGTPSTNQPKFWGGNIGWITPSDMSNFNGKYISKGKRSITQDGLDYSTAKLIPEKSILFSSRAPIGYVVIAKNPLATNQGFKNLIPTPSLNSDYVYYYLKSIKQLAESMASGTTFLELSASKFAQLPLPLPPLDEQLRISSKIDELFSELEIAELTILKVKRQIEIYRHSLLKNAFNGNLTGKWRTDNKSENVLQFIKDVNIYKNNLFEKRNKLWLENSVRNRKPRDFELLHRVVERDLPPIPQQWNWVNLGDICNIVRGASPRPAGDPRYFGGNIPWITVGELTKDDKIYLTSVSSYLTELGRDQSRYILKDTLLLTNSGATLGVPKITNIDGCINDGSVALLDIFDSKLKLYLYWFLKSKTSELRKNSQGAGQPNLNTEIVKNILIPLPSLSEQTQIVQEIEYRYTIIDNLSSIIRDTLLMIEGTRSSILNKAFRGQLVEQNSLEQNAEELLKQISLEKITYLEEQKRANEKRPKKLKNMEDKKTILEILIAANTSMTAKEVWIQSKHKDDIEAFYSELRDISDKILEIKKDTESLLSLRHEN